MPWANDHARMRRLPPDWKARRERVLRRDNEEWQAVIDNGGTKCLAWAKPL
jgi:hypothetical protein